MILRNLLLRNGQQSLKMMLPISITFIALGMMLLVMVVVWPKSSFPAPALGPDWNDFFRGLLVGIAIAMEIGGVVIAAVAAAAGIKKS